MIISNGLDLTMEFEWIGNNSYCEMFKVAKYASLITSFSNETIG